MEGEDGQYLFNILVIGSQAVGKTSLIKRYCQNNFLINEIATTAVQNQYTKILDVSEVPLKLVLEDTSGQERYRCIMPSCYRRAHGIVLVYDITNKRSFQELENWIQEIQDLISDNSGLNLMIIGNKTDLEEERQVTQEMARGLASKYFYMLYETSCKTALNVDVAFYELATRMLKTYMQTLEYDSNKTGISLHREHRRSLMAKKEKKKCC